MGPIELGEGVVVVVYDSQTGEIRLVHEEVTLTGGSKTEPGQLAQQALQLARSLGGQKRGELKTLVTTGTQIRIGPLHVDIAKQTLVPKQAARK